MKKAVAYKERTGNFDFSSPKLPSLAKFVMQTAMLYAARDIVEQMGATFCGVKCQDELSASICTACVATSYLGNDVAPDGLRQERIYPTSCENDMDTALTQVLLRVLTGRPAGFGDFRDVEEGILAIVNCGQHPTHFFGALRIDGFRPADEFKAAMDEMLDTFRSTPTVGEADRVLVAGQREFETRDERMAHGMPLHASVVALLRRLAEEVGLPIPEPLPSGPSQR